MPEEVKEYDSILLSTKKALGLSSDYTPFDPEIIMHINSVLNILNELGVGPLEGFSITGSDETWDQFTTEILERMCRTYMFLRVKLLFDPPTAATMYEAMSRQVDELGWRLNVSAEQAASSKDLNALKM